MFSVVKLLFLQNDLKILLFCPKAPYTGVLRQQNSANPFDNRQFRQCKSVEVPLYLP